MRADRKLVRELAFVVPLLWIAPVAFPDVAPCASLWAGKGGDVVACAEATLAQLQRDNYNVTVGDLDGMGEPAVPTLLKALSSDQALKRAGAADALGRIGMRLEKKTAIVDALAGHAGDTDLTTRQMVIGAIARIGFKTPAAEQAVRKAGSDPDPVMQGLAGYARSQLKLTEVK